MKKFMRERFGISAAVLKWLAVISMVIDHFACAVYPYIQGHNAEVYKALRGIGRIAFPIYCFLLVEGFFYTKNVWKYLRNLVLFAAISEIPFNMAVFGHVFYPKGQNVYWSLALGICAMILLKRFEGFAMRQIFLQAAVIVLFLFLGEHLEVDYHWKGIAYIILFYYLRNLRFRQSVTAIAGAAAFVLYERAAVFAFLLVYLYNGKRGRQFKYLFYGIYPLHLLVFGLLRFWLNGNL
ncbi:MAG: conjugal transfer protein TraX [Lachnospiraceae bacterium]|nr:conjugal transfer protein TraX [Lachnospiraceae bacterium]